VALHLAAFEQNLPGDIVVAYDEEGVAQTFQCTRRNCSSKNEVMKCALGKASNINRHIGLCKARAHERNQATSLDSYLLGADTQLVTQATYEQRTLDIVFAAKHGAARKFDEPSRRTRYRK
jgi:hypothetical protein